MNELKVNNLRIFIKKKKIIDNISFSVKQGEWLTIVGENGAGKTSLVRAIVNIKENRKKIIKEIKFNNKNINNKLVKEKFSYISQIAQVIPGITVKEYVSLAFYAISSPFAKIKKGDKDKILKAIKMVGMQGKENELITSLSGGELQKTSLALGLVYDRDVIILDEPTNHLDMKAKIDIVKIIKKIHQRGKTIILITHDLNLAARVSNNILLLKNGKMEKSGAVKDIMKKQIIKKVFNVETKISSINGIPQIVEQK